ncbi:hypothetical protein JCM3774_005858 [Rhodotorula dairenensis]
MTGEVKNIVVVGLGLAAAEAVKALVHKLPTDHRIVAIAENEGFWPIASLRAAVVPGWEDKPVASVDPVVPRGSRHVLLKRTSGVELREHSVVIDQPHPELGTEIPFEYCILATGSDYPWPCRPRKGASMEEIKHDFQDLQSQVAASSSILVVGGGPVGIEFAGEVAAHYNGKAGRSPKEITVVHAQEKYLTEPGWKDGFNSSIQNQLEALGVRTVFGAKVDGLPKATGKLAGGKQSFSLSNGETVTADFVFLAIGNSPNTHLIRDLDSQSINPSNRLVKVKPSFQVAGHSNLFAIGDIADVDESKIYAHAKNHGAVVATNILNLLNCKNATAAGSEPSLKAYKPGPMLMIVSIGPKGGAGQLFGMVVGSWFSWFAKSRSLFVDAFQKTYA